jgi:hypothetical protein
MKDEIRFEKGAGRTYTIRESFSTSRENGVYREIFIFNSLTLI